MAYKSPFSKAPLEKEIQPQVKAEIKKIFPNAYLWKNHNQGIYAASGLPDLMFVNKGQLYAIEVKRPGEEPTPLQRSTLKALAYAGARVAWVVSKEEARELLTGWIGGIGNET